MDLLPPDARPDYIAVHVYSTTFEAFKAKIEEYWNTFHLPIWLTEFAMTVCLRFFGQGVRADKVEF
jgi:hypothetical protein